MPAVDLPFHGKSQLSYTNLWALSEEIGSKAPKGSFLIGWSLGASLAIMISYLFPFKFRGLLLIGGSACFGCLWPQKNLRAFLLKLERQGEQFLKEFRSMAYPKPFEDHVELEGAKRLLKDYMALDIRSILPHVRQRVILVHGLKDPVTPFTSALTLYNLLKDAKLISFSGGHFPEDENLILKVLKSMP